MAEKTKIQWCHHTFNPWVGCAKVADGCKFCYAENLMDTRYGRVEWGPKGTRSRTKTWRDPSKWNKEAGKVGERHRTFCASLADVFEDFQGSIITANGDVLWRDKLGRYDHAEATAFQPFEIATLDHLRADLFQLIDLCENLDWLLLTKRPENIVSMWGESAYFAYPFRNNVWLGTSIAHQRDADKYIDRLLIGRTLARHLFLSIEPQIDFVDLHRWLYPEPLIDWVIIGGESKQGSEEPRRFDIRWAKDMIYDCAQAGVPCFVKQFGSNVYDGRKKLVLHDKHGGDMSEWAEDFRVRQVPNSIVKRDPLIAK